MATGDAISAIGSKTASSSNSAQRNPVKKNVLNGSAAIMASNVHLTPNQQKISVFC